MGLLEPGKYGEHYHELFVNSFYKRKNLEKSPRRKNKKRKDVGDQNLFGTNFSSLNIELEPNASKFCLFSAVRSAVLETESKYIDPNSLALSLSFKKSSIPVAVCCNLCAVNCRNDANYDCRCHINNIPKSHGNDNETDGESETENISEKEILQKVPQIVSAGLRSLFELIAEARNSHPSLCTKALKALFDVIQGQTPESFKSEPNELINPMYDLLLDLATLHGPGSSDKNDANSWSAIGCSSLLGLSVARGDTGKILKAVAALIMSPKILSSQNIQLPNVLTTLQRSVHSVALGSINKPDYFKNGVPINSLVDEFCIKNQLSYNYQHNFQPSIASDGKHLYILLSKALLKIGTGFNGTLKGHIYASSNEFSRDKNGWIGYCNNTLYYKRISKRNNESIFTLSTETLAITGSTQIKVPPIREGQNCVVFCDEESLYTISTTKDDALMVKQLHSLYTTNSFDLPLKLARKSIRTLGYACFEEEVLNQNQIQKIQSSFNPFEPKLPNDIEVANIICGKEFGLVRGSNGKVFYFGKAVSLGLKSVGKSPTLKMTELIISKVASITNIALGHDGVHALLVNEDGGVYFTGSARRGEDGDSSKNRRQPKAVKPKKITKIDGHFVVQASCNNGTSAFVTKAGKLVMLGKDTTYCDSFGFVTALYDQTITKVALGKAHCVALNSKGHLITFGLNNKGQCGRVSAKEKEAGSSAMETSVESKNNTEISKQYDMTNMCDPDDHTFIHGKCRVCTVCKECTGYNVTCVAAVSTQIEERIPGAFCICGHGDAGCSKCGACFTCIKYQETMADDTVKDVNYSLIGRQRTRSLILKKKDKKLGTDENSLATDVERDAPRVATLPPQKLTLPSSSPVVQISVGLHHTVVLTLAGEVFTFGSNQFGQLGTGDLQPVQGPVQVNVPGLISQVAAGSNHTVLLTYKGIVYTFGNYQKGQLGRLPSDIQGGVNINEEELSSNMSSNTVGITSDDHPQSAQNLLMQRKKFLWNCTPGQVTNIGPNYGKRASWISASGDQTFIKIDESLVTGSMLSKLNVVADKSTILLIPNIPFTFNCLAINRHDGVCNAHVKNQIDFAKIMQTHCNLIKKTASDDKSNQNINEDNNVKIHPIEIARTSESIHEARNHNIFNLQDGTTSRTSKISQQKNTQQSVHHGEKILPQLAFCIDPCYSVLWVFDAVSKKVMVYNVLAGEMNSNSENHNNFMSILTPEVALPLKSSLQITRNQASLNLLACLDILTSAQDSISLCFETITPQIQNPLKESQSNEYQIVNRFENFGGGWGYSGHSLEAIRFMSDTDILVGGFSMFGGRGEYTCKIKIYDLGLDGGGYEKDGLLILETEDIPYECQPRNKYNVMLPKPFIANAGKWFLIWVKISGPSSDCGAAGQATVTTEDQVVFSFKSSKKANNGTDVNSGQIPSILYKVINQETKQSNLSFEIDPVQRISKYFANTVSKECFESLVLLLNWAWGTFKVTLFELRDKKKYLQTRTSLDQLSYINKVCLRLLRKYINVIYPNDAFYKCEPSPHKTEVHQSQHSHSESDLPNKNLVIAHENKLNAVFDGAAAAAVLGALAQPQQQQHNQSIPIASSSKQSKLFSSCSIDSTTPTNQKKFNSENLHLAESIGDVRALLIQILCDFVHHDIEDEGLNLLNEVYDECHTTFVSCYNAFYPTSTLKWNCLCDLLMQMDRGCLFARYLSAILGGLCSPTVKLRSTFSLLSPIRECKSQISPSDNSGLPMLTSSDIHLYPVLVEQMIYRTQQEKCDFMFNSWSFKDVLVRLLDIISNPIKKKIENLYNHRGTKENSFLKLINQGLIDNCCHLLARVLAEIVYQSCTSDFDISLLPTRSLHSTGTRFTLCDRSRTWNTGNFGPDAIAFSVDRPGIAIAGAMIYSGSGNYEYQLELLLDSSELKLSPSQHRWETIESIAGSYDQEAVQNDMFEIKFERPVHIKERIRYALRLCSQGARTYSGDAGLSSIRGPCGTNFSFYPCDLSFNGTTPTRGQIPCILYYSSPTKNEYHNGQILKELHARDTALHIASDIIKRCTELLILARNAIALSVSPSDKSPNSSNNTQTIDSEHNITPIEEHLDIAWANNSNLSSARDQNESNVSTARDITKKIESFSKGIIETLKFDKRTTNPFECEIEIGATDINAKDLIEEIDLNEKNGKMSKINGNNRIGFNELDQSDSDDSITQISREKILDMFGMEEANLFHKLLPLVFAHVGPLVSSDPKSSVQILTLIREILPHVTALNQLYSTRDSMDSQNEYFHEGLGIIGKTESFGKSETDQKLCTTSNHYCIVESDHPYKSGAVTSYRVQFPQCVQWISVEFDPQCGTVQPEDSLIISIPSVSAKILTENNKDNESAINLDTYRSDGPCKNLEVLSNNTIKEKIDVELFEDWVVAKRFNSISQWPNKSIIFPGNKIEFSLETASDYANDHQYNHFGFKCQVIGYDNPCTMRFPNFSLIRLENELAYLGGMCSANLMKKDLILPDDSPDDLSSIENTINMHSTLLSKGLSLPDTLLTIHDVLDSQFPKGGQSNERQFLKDFVSCAPGSAGARLAHWLQPEPRIDPNQCELKPIQEPIRYGWPTQLVVVTRDQYGDIVLVPDLKVKIKAVPAGVISNANRKSRRNSQSDTTFLGGIPLPPKINYEPTIKEKMCFKAITFMKAFQQYSFEELRFSNPIQSRKSEILDAQDLNDGTFGVTWTPNFIGNCCLTVTIDGIPLEEITRVEVKEAGILPPLKSNLKKSQPQNKLRKFMAKNSAGLRIRSHPTLQSEQVGIIALNGVITFIDEVENDDGVWVRLSTQSIRQHCTAGWYPTEAWCLQYNQHLGRTLLHPVFESQSSTSTTLEKTTKIEEVDNEALICEQTPKAKSPGKKGFDFSSSKFTPPLSSDINDSKPFVFTSNQSSKLSPKQLNTQKEFNDTTFDLKKNSVDKDIPKSNLLQAFDSAHKLNDSQFNRGNQNIGTTIAGVVGGGASKLQALHKWFKGDSIECNKDPGRKKSDIPEIASVSVRDIVKAIGGQDLRSNGNNTVSPQISRSSSPVAIPLKQRDFYANQSGSSKSIEVSETSALISSSSHDFGHSPSISPNQFNSKDDDHPKFSLDSNEDCSIHNTPIKSANFSVGSPNTYEYNRNLLSSKFGGRKLRTRRSVLSGSPHHKSDSYNADDSAINSNLDQIKLAGSSEENNKRMFESEKSLNTVAWKNQPLTQINDLFETNSQSTNENETKIGPKRALPPSLAESLRAVFAAFLYHEGIVHDAMACASFLKFHPTLPKDGAPVVTRGDHSDTHVKLTKEEKAQQRHSVEVANAGNYLNIRPSTLESLTKSGISSLYNRRYRKGNFDNDSNEKTKLSSVPEVIKVLPPALRSLVYLWEQICSSCVELVQLNSFDQLKDSNVTVRTQVRETDVDNFNERETRSVRKKKKDDASAWCELCELLLPLPVPHHMRMVHPGCGKQSKGKGYNSVGNYCTGWAGNCGEGGKGASSWYLMCEKCREKYMSGNKNINNVNSEDLLNSSVSTGENTVKKDNLLGIKTNVVFNSEAYKMMKENALFLLELSSTNSVSLNNQKKSPQHIATVNEVQSNNILSDNNRPSTSRKSKEFRISTSGRLTNSSKTMISNNSHISPFSKNLNIPTHLSPDLIWPAPEILVCLDSLGASVANDLPYEIFGINENGFDRPLSDVSFESVDPNPADILQTPSNHPATPSSSSKFHRSLSMGQGWSAQPLSKYQQSTETPTPEQVNRIILRRRNNSNVELKDSGSLLLCNPSPNLRKLVPDNVLTSSCVIQKTGNSNILSAAKKLELDNIENIKNSNISLDGDNSSSVSNETSSFSNFAIIRDLRANSTENYFDLKESKKCENSEQSSKKVDELNDEGTKKIEDLEERVKRISKLDENHKRGNEFDEDEDNENDHKKLENLVEETPKKIYDVHISEINGTRSLLSRPAIAFILQQHDLEKLRLAMKRNLRIATCRIYSLQALNWLMRSVTQPSGLHDLMWWFVTALTSSIHEHENYKIDDSEFALEHPVNSTQMSGKVSLVLSQSLHMFLQTVADLTLHLPGGSALQRIAIQCFGIKFHPADHQFLHRSHVFGNISQILSKTEEQNDELLMTSIQDTNLNSGSKITSLIDLQGMFEITVSSRPALAGALTDNSTETFWESDEEDRNKAKIIEISLSKLNYVCKGIFVHIDNSRDVGSKVTNIAFYAGQSLGDTNLVQSIDVESKVGCWVSCNIKDESATHYRLELKGPENTLRVRQIKLLGFCTIPDDVYSFVKHNPKLSNAYQIQQRNCETETLRVFKLITGQVFGKLIIGGELSTIDINTVQPSPALETSTTSLLADSLDMREHMVGILFSRSKLSHLQKQVIVHIVHAIQKEAQRAREEWEILNANFSNTANNLDQKSESSSSEQSRATDTYCFEMLSMVLALSGSAVGRSYLSHQFGLLKDLLSLLHTGSDRVQRQVTALLRRMLPEISPDNLGELLNVHKMPPNDFNIVNHNSEDFDMGRLGILDIFLAVVAKSLQLQIKVKTTAPNTSKNPATVKLSNCIDFSVHNLKSKTDCGEVETSYQTPIFCNTNPFENDKIEKEFLVRRKPKEHTKNLNQRWFLKGNISVKQSENFIGLIRDMSSGKLSEKWGIVTKAAIAESILNLTRLDETFRTPESCVKTATLWLALASLCVLDKEHVEKLSSGKWSKATETRPQCSNHDDGITPAIILCDSCGSLCSDCDRFLHLNRKKRIHHRTVCKEEEEAIRVELHESCGRTKLFWLLALADSKTLKAVVEFRDGNHAIISDPPNSVGRCRFCGITGNSGLLAIGNVCADAQCQEYAENACAKIKPCGHVCGGVAYEQKCLPCLQHTCLERENDLAEKSKEPKLTQDADDMCMICFTEALSCAPSIQLECGHVFHFHCCKAVLNKRWNGPRISFGFSLCPICKTDINHPSLLEILSPINALKNDVKRKALMRLEYEGIVKKTDNKDLTAYAMDRYAYYVCFKCQKAYYGGEARCDAEMGENYNPQELVCGGCSDIARAKMCPKHGTDYLEYKCRYCCSVAVFFCFGSTHFCDTCHDDFQRLTNIPKNKLPQCPAGPRATQLLGDDCPLHVIHPPTGEEFALGCGICRNAHTF